MKEGAQLRQRLARVADALNREIDEMRSEFKGRTSACLDTWQEYEVAQALPGHLNYTLVPPDFYERLARAALRVVAPCPQCRGFGYGPMTPDFEGDDPETMTLGTVSMCPLCGGAGIDPNYRLTPQRETGGDVPRQRAGCKEFDSRPRMTIQS